jgi:phosphatidylglycerophosphate synthase
MAVALATALACRGMARHYPHARAGACNVVTLARAAMPALLTAVVLAPAPPGSAAMWVLAALAALALVADGADGWLARRSGLDSAFGARFDMEVDAALAAMLCLAAIGTGKAGLWLLPLGVMRYAFLAAMPVFPWLKAPLPPRAGRKTVCVIQIAVLAALMAPPVSGLPATLLATAATALLSLSFAADIHWLWQRR